MSPVVALFVLAAVGTAPSPQVSDAAVARAEADRLFDSGDLPGAAVAYRRVLALSPCVSEPSSVARTAKKSGNVVSPGDGVLEPRVVRLGAVRPTDHGGAVVLLALISETGKVIENRVVHSSNNLNVDQAATASLTTAEFAAATKDGTPAKMWKTFKIVVPSE